MRGSVSAGDRSGRNEGGLGTDDPEDHLDVDVFAVGIDGFQVQAVFADSLGSAFGAVHLDGDGVAFLHALKNADHGAGV